MTGRTLAALLGGFILGFWLAAVCAETRIDECAQAGAIVVGGVAYTVSPMQEKGWDDGRR